MQGWADHIERLQREEDERLMHDPLARQRLAELAERAANTDHEDEREES